jgi:lauroyl/myristoyl acyltransferase
MAAIVGGTPRAGEVEKLARAHVVENFLRAELFWRVDRLGEIPVVGREHFEAAIASGRGILVSGIHLGLFFVGMEGIAEYGRVPYVVSGGWLLEPPAPGLPGYALEHWRTILRRRGVRVIATHRSFPLVRAVLEQGQVALVAFDMPGGTETRFLGKPVMLSAGTARLAVAGDALVVPAVGLRRGHRVIIHIEEPIDPRGFDGVVGLHRALTEIHERLILAQPEAYENPRRLGAWGPLATPERWGRGPDAPQTADGTL